MICRIEGDEFRPDWSMSTVYWVNTTGRVFNNMFNYCKLYPGVVFTNKQGSALLELRIQRGIRICICTVANTDFLEYPAT